jgi:hypothetical protein
MAKKNKQKEVKRTGRVFVDTTLMNTQEMLCLHLEFYRDRNMRYEAGRIADALDAVNDVIDSTTIVEID